MSVGSMIYADRFFVSRTRGTEVTTYDYSLRGELLRVYLSDGTVIEYVHDPLGRRIAKKVNGTVTEKYLWQGLTRLLAVYNADDTLKMRFEYADARMPVAMTKGGMTYYLGYDQVGTLKAVADASGNVVRKLEYDAFGNILSDSDPMFAVPFGFAGGLHDPDTGLVRFGYRDYDPETGRWAAKDPILFGGGDTDLYGYCLNDPISFIDPYGLSDMLSSFRAFHNGYAISSVCLKDIHYYRNECNNAPETENEAKKKEGWRKLSPLKSVFHRQGRGNECNSKYVSSDGHHEGVYKNGKRVDDPLNMGTYNYSSPDNPVGHFINDILPYYIWGNTPDDPSGLMDKLMAPLTVKPCDCK